MGSVTWKRLKTKTLGTREFARIGSLQASGAMKVGKVEPVDWCEDSHAVAAWGESHFWAFEGRVKQESSFGTAFRFVLFLVWLGLRSGNFSSFSAALIV